MLPLLTAEQLQAEDLRTIRDLPIPSIDLMERASRAFCDALLKDWDLEHVTVLCGPGNNGGDGMAIARMLLEEGIIVKVYIPEDQERFSPDMQKNLARWQALEQPTRSLGSFPSGEGGMVIDALFGSGLSRPLSGAYAEVVAQVNKAGLEVVSVDLPSGMPVEPRFNWQGDQVVRATHVYTFQYPKLSLLCPAAKGYAEHWSVVDIGLLPYQGDITWGLMEEPELRERYRPPSVFDHKYSKGHVSLIGGSKGKAGSIVLAAIAAYRTGAGLVTVHCPKCVVDALQQQLPEAMIHSNGTDHLDELGVLHPRSSALGIGPGLGLDQWPIVAQALETGLPLVIDADALRCLSGSKRFDMLHSSCILTPHEGEFRALVGSWSTEWEKYRKAMEFAAEYGCYVLLKGSYTAVTNGSQLLFVPVGHPAMGTAGSGDVLTGLLSCLLATGMPAWDVVRLGPYLHVAAARHWLTGHSSSVLLASDIAQSIGQVLRMWQE